jgi:hypothetical protein
LTLCSPPGIAGTRVANNLLNQRRFPDKGVHVPCPVQGGMDAFVILTKLMLL